MARTKTFRVVDGRMRFVCHACGTKRVVSVAPGVRRRSVRCHKCDELTRCNLNRRQTPREQQLGRVTAIFGDGRELEVDLADISFYGVGFDLSFRDMGKVKVGQDVKFHCSWNPRLLSIGRYIVRSVKGQRIGAQIKH